MNTKRRMFVTLGALTLLIVMASVGSAFAFTDTKVSGRVVTTSGQPVVGITVWTFIQTNTGAWTSNSAGTTDLTDANGEYEVTFHNSTVPAEQPTTECTLLFEDRRQLMPRKDVFRATWFGNKDGTLPGIVSWPDQATGIATHFTVTSGVPQTGRDAIMKHHYGHITGKVTDRAGKPLQNVVVTAWGKISDPNSSVSTGNGTSMMTDAAGNYELYVYPHLVGETWWTVTAEGVRNSHAYHGLWYPNVLNVMSLSDKDESIQAGNTRFTLDSEQEATNVNFSLTENKKDTLSFSYAKPKKKGSKTLIAAGYLDPLHDPTIKITAKIYKYNASKKKYVYKYTVPVKQSASGLKTKWSISKKVAKGKYKVTVSVGTHLWWDHRATSASKKVTIK